MIDTDTKKRREFIAKIEKAGHKSKLEDSPLYREYQLLKLMREKSVTVYVHNFHEDYTTGSLYYVMILDLLEDSLMDHKKPYGLQKCLDIATRLIEIVRAVHAEGLVVRDIRADSFCFDSCGNIYLTHLNHARAFLSLGRYHIPW